MCGSSEEDLRMGSLCKYGPVNYAPGGKGINFTIYIVLNLYLLSKRKYFFEELKNINHISFINCMRPLSFSFIQSNQLKRQNKIIIR